MIKSAIVSAAQAAVLHGSELNSVCDDRINLILDQLYESYAWTFLSKDPPATVTLSAGSQTATLPSDFMKIETLMLIDSVSNPTFPPNIPLVPKRWGDFQQILVPTQTADKPQFYALNHGYSDSMSPVSKLYFWPIPTLSWSLRLSYFYKPAFDIADGSEPEFPDTKTLFDLLVNELYQYLKDPRYDRFLMEKIIERSRRNSAQDPYGYTFRAPLSKELFRTNVVRGNWLDRNR